MTAVGSGGQVVALDSGQFGPVTITQSISLVAPAGVFASIDVPSGNGITYYGLSNLESGGTSSLASFGNNTFAGNSTDENGSVTTSVLK